MKYCPRIKLEWLLSEYLSYCCLYFFIFKTSQKKKKRLNPALNKACLYLLGAPIVLWDRKLNIVMPVWKVSKVRFRKVINLGHLGFDSQSFGVRGPKSISFYCIFTCAANCEIEPKALTYSAVFFPWCHGCCFCIAYID